MGEFSRDNIARFFAHFDSECGGCGDAIDEGDDIGYDKNTDEYICASCIAART